MISQATVADLVPILVPDRVLLIGEILGTREFPDLVTLLVAQVVSGGGSVVVGLEVPFNERLDGQVWGPFWTRDRRYADGRSSLAMAELVTTLADLRATGYPVTPVGLDAAWVAPGSPVDLSSLDRIERPRDEAMAGHFLAAMDSRPRSAGILLAGPEHTGITQGSGTLGSIVAPWFPGTIALVGLTTGGEALTLAETGPVVAHVPADSGTGEGAVWSTEPGADGHHGFVNVGSVSASEPFPSDEPPSGTSSSG